LNVEKGLGNAQYRGVIPLDSFNLAQEYGSSDFDTRLNFTTFLTYDIPGSSHGPKLLTHGWQLSSPLSFHSGQPFNFDAGTQRPRLNIIGNPFAGVSNAFVPGVGAPYVNPAPFCGPFGDQEHSDRRTCEARGRVSRSICS
jgi:hypothetical protein